MGNAKAGEGEGVRAEGPGVRAKRPWGWLAAGLVVLAALAALVYGVNLQQQQATKAIAYARSVAFSPDGRLLASGSLDNTVKL
jgi:hypothetical protein